MDTNTTPNDNLFDLSVDTTARDLLKSAATWAKIVAIIGLSSAALGVVQAFLVSRNVGSTAMGTASNVLISIIVVAFSVILNIFLLRFATSMQSGLRGVNQPQFNAGVSNLALYWKVMGIFIIVAMSLMVLAVMIAIAFAALGGRA